MTVPDLCHKHSVGQSTYYKWKVKYGDMEQSEFKLKKELEEENAKLKKMFADVNLQNVALKNIIETKQAVHPLF